MSPFPSIHIEGGLLGPDTLDELLAGELCGQRRHDFGINGRRTLTDEIASLFADARMQWEAFHDRLERLPDSDPATSVTRDGWMVPFLRLLGYELRYNPRAYEIDGMTFAISHRVGEREDAPPVHIVGAKQELGRVAPTGRPRLAPHSLVQEFLNRSEQLWGIVTNGLTLRLLRDSTYIRRQAYIEFDLRQILEEQRFNDFAVLYRLLHRTRLPNSAADARDCLLEQYYQRALEQGGRVRDRLRDGVEECIKRLATGFLEHPDNAELRARLAGSELRVASSEEEPPLATRHAPLAPEEFYRQLLRLVYRFLFLLVSEDRGLISADPLYREHYGVARLRRLLERRSAYTDHDDLWCSLRVLWKVLADENLAGFLGAAPLNGELFEPIALDACTITNRALLDAFQHLAYFQESSSQRRVNYAALDVEELGSVYESLLEYHPQVDSSGTVPTFDLAPGSERKSTGSYYTPPELVAELIRSALEPVIEERLAEARRMANELQRVAGSEWRVVEKTIHKVGGGHADPIVSRLGSLAESYGAGGRSLSLHERLFEAGAFRPDQPNAPGSDVGPSEHRGRMGSPRNEGISAIPEHRLGQPPGAGDLPPARRTDWDREAGTRPSPSSDARNPEQTDGQPPAQPQTEIARSITDLPALWASLPPAARQSLLAVACAEQALLSIRVLDPACGSGHFLLAAARRLGKELARIRTGEEEPAPERVREAVRDVVAHCIYGVDKNPLAVELCRVALWLEAHCAGKPLTFLDHRVRCGDSLVGVFDLAVLERGIPDEAFAPASGDDKTVVDLLKKRNRSERRDLESGQMSLPFHPGSLLPALGAESRTVAEIADDSPAEVRRKKERYERCQHDPQRSRLAQACNLWTAAFFQKLASSDQRVTSSEEEEPLATGHSPLAEPPLATRHSPLAAERAITTQVLVDHLAGRAHPQAIAEGEALAFRSGFFHWPLEFPEVFSASSEVRVASSEEEQPPATRYSPLAEPPLATRHSPFADSGFDVVLGNPPWDRIKLQEQEFFAVRDPRVANAPTAATRKRFIERLPDTNPKLWEEYRHALHAAECTSRFLRGSGFYPLTGRGDINTYSVFAERMRALLRPGGRAGIIVPSGIATDDTNKFFFANLVDSGELASLYDFENRKGIFPAVHRSYKFCLLTVRRVGSQRAAPLRPSAEFAFFCHEASDLADPERRFTLRPEDFRLLNPNTRTAPIFRSRRDAELTKAIYRRVPVLVEASRGEAGDIWGLEDQIRRFFDMNKPDTLHLCQRAMAGKVRPCGQLPMYEAKMIHQFDHRFGDYRDQPEGSASTQLPEVPLDRLGDPNYQVLPRYWVPEDEVEARLKAKAWDRGWLLGWRDITNVTNERTVIAAVIPRCGTDFTLRIAMPKSKHRARTLALLALLNSAPFDYCARNKVGGTHAADFLVKQLPVLPPSVFDKLLPFPWSPDDSPLATSDRPHGQPQRVAPTVADFIRPRVLELTYTAWDLKPFAEDLGYDGPPFRYDPERRFVLRCELDALFFHLYLPAEPGGSWRRATRDWAVGGETPEEFAALTALFPTPRDAVAYILDQFPIVRRKDEERYGVYRTKETILKRYDEMCR